MHEFDAGCAALADQLGKNRAISLATCVDNDVSVRVLDGYYRDGRIWFVSHSSALHMKQIPQNQNVAVCQGMFQGLGTAEILGSPKAPENREIREEFIQAMPHVYEHVDEDNPKITINCITLKYATVFSGQTKYRMDFAAKTATVKEFGGYKVPDAQ